MQLCHTSTAPYDCGQNPAVRPVRVWVQNTVGGGPRSSVEDSFLIGSVIGNVILILFNTVLANGLSGKNVPAMTYLMSSRMLNRNSVNQSSLCVKCLLHVVLWWACLSVCLSVCLPVCLQAYFRNHTYELHQIFCDISFGCVSVVMAALKYVMHFQFSESEPDGTGDITRM